MPRFISSVRGTVRGVVKHALWYLDWQTGGTTVLDPEERSTG